MSLELASSLESSVVTLLLSISDWLSSLDVVSDELSDWDDCSEEESVTVELLSLGAATEEFSWADDIISQFIYPFNLIA